MRIGFDAKRIFQNSTGLGNYSRQLVKTLAAYFPSDEYFLFTPGTAPEGAFTLNGNTRILSHTGILNSIWRSYGIQKDLLKADIEVFHGLSNEIPFSLPHKKIKTVVTIHDLIFKKYPHHYPLIDRNIYNLKSGYACRNADHIIAASESTKADIIASYNTDPRNITVIYQSCDDLFYEKYAAERIESISLKYRLPATFILYVGSLTERKNLMGICAAYLNIPEAGRVPCIVVGRGKAYAQKVKRFISENKLEKYFIFPEDVATDELPVFYQKAVCLVYPSFYEGLGIPVIEAMVSGCPVITSNRSALPEAGGNAAIYVDPENSEEIADKIKKIIAGALLRSEMIQRGYEQIKKFDKKIIADKVHAVYAGLKNP